MSDPIEIELKLEFARSDRDRLIASPLLDAPGQTKRLIAAYFDTPALDLKKAGFSLRVRTDGDKQIQTIKASTGSASLLARNEWERPIEGNLPILDDKAGPIGDHVSPRQLDQIAPLFVTSIDRVVRPLELPGATVVECAIDTGEVVAKGHSMAVTELEIELVSGPAQGLFDLARRIDAEIPLRLGVLSKSARGYALLEDKGRAAIKAGPIQLSPDMSTAKGLATIVQSCLEQYRLNEALLLDDAAPEAVHQARVAIRRLRSALSLFKPLVAADPRTALIAAELKWLAREYGDVRDLDVLLPKLDDRGRAAIGAIRDARFDHLRSLLESGRVRLLPIDILEWIELGAWRTQPAGSDLADRPIRDFAGKRLDRMRKHIAREGADFTTLDDEHRHTIRKDAKKLRYASEFFVAIYPGRTARRRMDGFLGAIEDLQDSLGKLNDDATTGELLTRHALDITLSKLSDKKRARLLHQAGNSLQDLLDYKRFWRA